MTADETVNVDDIVEMDGYLTDTCLSAQDQYKAVLDYFRIKY